MTVVYLLVGRFIDEPGQPVRQKHINAREYKNLCDELITEIAIGKTRYTVTNRMQYSVPGALGSTLVIQTDLKKLENG